MLGVSGLGECKVAVRLNCPLMSAGETIVESLSEDADFVEQAKKILCSYGVYLNRKFQSEQMQ